MIDIVNYQFKGYPVMMYGMMLVTIGALTFATVGGSVALPSLPSLTPESSSTPPAPSPVLSNPVPVAPTVASTPSTPQGGKHKRRSTKHHNLKHKTNKSKKHHK
jgi:hypothetical protein